jgi:hypothetical protein
MKSEREIWKLLSNRTFIGDVLRYFTSLEFELNAVIAQYFIRSDRYEDAMEVLLPELSLGRKLELLTRLPIRKSLLSYQRAISGLRRFQRVRNIVAHNPHISFSKAKSLSNDGNYRQILHEYPKGMQEEFKLTRRSLSRLLRVREFRNPQSNEVINTWTIWFKNWLG